MHLACKYNYLSTAKRNEQMVLMVIFDCEKVLEFQMRDNFLNYDLLSLLVVRKRLGEQPMERHMTKYSTFRMYDVTFRMYVPTLLITHQHSEYAPTWQIRTNLPANTHQHGKYAPTCIRQYHLARYRRMQVGAYLRVHVDAYLQFTSVAF